MDRYKRATNDDQDQYVLKIFLPLLCIAILACVGGCCYMERRRRRRKKKNGGVDPEELRQQQDLDDALSVISTSSSKRRHYLDPTPTTGRLVRGAAVRSNYSTVGEPLYDSEKRRASSMRSRNQYPDWNEPARRRDAFRETQHRPVSRSGSGYGDRPLSRARSMVDVSSKYGDRDRSFRRSRSSTNLGRLSSDMTDSGYQENQSNSETENMYEFLNLQTDKDADKASRYHNGYNCPASPTRSEYSIRTAPSMVGRDDYQSSHLRSHSVSRPSSVQNFTVQRNPLMRSMSQPDLQALDSKTYPQGILKKEVFGDHRRNTSMQYGHSGNPRGVDAQNGYSGYYGQADRSSSQHRNSNASEDPLNARASSRPSSVLNYSRTQGYDPYYSRQYGDYQHYGGYSQPPSYSAAGYHRHRQLPGKYRTGYDQYGGYGDYWGNYSQNHRMGMY